MRLIAILLACTVALAVCSQGPQAVDAAVAAPAAASPDTVAADAVAIDATADAEAAPDTRPNLMSFANGTVMPMPFDGLLVTAPILMIDGSAILNWVGDGKPQSFVFELPETATLRTLEFDDDTSGMGGIDSGIKDLNVEVSSTSMTDGYQTIFSGSLAKGGNGQRFEVDKPIAGRWVRVNFTSNHGGDSYSLAEFRAFGDAPVPALETNASGSYETHWGTWNLTQAGTMITGCFQPAGLSTYPGRLTGGMQGNVASVRYVETDDAGDQRPASAMVLVFPRDGTRFYSGVVDGEGVSDYSTVKRISDKPANCPGRPVQDAATTMADTLEKDGRVAVYGINFDFNSARLRPESTTVLEQVAQLLRATPGLSITIEGHTDDIGGDAFNQALSEKRANAVKDWLVQAGIDASRLDASGKGESAPVATNGNDLGRAQNRRVELVRR